MAEPVDLPLHFFTIVLNGEPFIRYHLEMFRRLPFRWRWHVVEGVAALVHDTAWSVADGGRIDSAVHADGLSVDGTSMYLDEIAAEEPERVTLYRKSRGEFWDGKREMVAAPLGNIREECLLWEVDSDELWTVEQITAVRQLFVDDPGRTAAYYWCHYVPAPGAVITTRYNYAENPAQDWLRTWRFRPGDRWASHEPPVLERPSERLADLAAARPFLHDETEAAGAVFQHFAYATEAQVLFKESYYGYSGALDSWSRLRDAVASSRGPLRLGDYLPWVTDDTLVDRADRRHVRLLARRDDAGDWTFDRGDMPSRSAPVGTPPFVIDGVFFQDLNTGIARVWRSLFREWVETGFAERIVFLERGGAGPRLPGLPTRSLPRWDREQTAADAFRLQLVCDEENAGLFVSTYYTTPIGTPSLMLVYDMIPERLRLDMSDPVWDEKHLAIEHADSFVCISENTRRDLQELAESARGKPAHVAVLGVDDHFFEAADADAAAFRAAYGIEKPYFIVVGDRRGTDGYKNVGLLFRALRDWSEASAHEVVCVGGAEELEPELTRLAPRVRARRFALADSELRGAYAGALALVFPSRYEGFGLPVAEAMACGCPVITTAVSSLPEVAGDAAVYVSADDPDALRRAFDEVRDERRRAELVGLGKERASRFRWPVAAAAVAAALVDAAAHETGERRLEREASWAGRRRHQAAGQLEAARRASARTPGRPVVSPVTAARLKLLARKHLPPPVVERLRRLRSAARRRLRASRRRVASRQQPDDE